MYSSSQLSKKNTKGFRILQSTLTSMFLNAFVLFYLRGLSGGNRFDLQNQKLTSYFTFTLKKRFSASGKASRYIYNYCIFIEHFKNILDNICSNI